MTKNHHYRPASSSLVITAKYAQYSTGRSHTLRQYTMQQWSLNAVMVQTMGVSYDDVDCLRIAELIVVFNVDLVVRGNCRGISMV